MKRDRFNLELQALERKIRLLLVNHTSLKKDLEAVKGENVQLKNVIKAKDDQIDHFQNKIKISTIVDSISVGESEATEVKNKIDDYIKEIDKCINQLSK